MRKFADKLRNFSTTPTPESKPSSGGQGHRHRRHSTLSASATYSPLAHGPAGHDSAVATPESNWAGGLLSPDFAPQRLLGQFGTTPQPQSSAKQGFVSQARGRNQSDGSALAAAATAAPSVPSHSTSTAAVPADMESDAAATAALRQGSEGQMMLLPKGVDMNDLLTLADEMDPVGTPAKKGKKEKRVLTADSTMQLAAYLASKVSIHTQ